MVTDAAGGSATCSHLQLLFTTHKSQRFPRPGNITRSTDAGTCGATVAYNVSYGDNCSPVTLQQVAGLVSGATFPVGSTLNTFVATDAAGNTETCSFTVTVTDNDSANIYTAG